MGCSLIGTNWAAEYMFTSTVWQPMRISLFPTCLWAKNFCYVFIVSIYYSYSALISFIYIFLVLGRSGIYSEKHQVTNIFSTACGGETLDFVFVSR